MKKVFCFVLKTIWIRVEVQNYFYHQMIAVSVSLTFSIQFGELLITMGVSSTAGAWLFNVHAFIWCLMPSITGPICRRFTSRRVAVLASLLLSSCFLGLVFVSSPLHIFFLYSIGCGEEPNERHVCLRKSRTIASSHMLAECSICKTIGVLHNMLVQCPVLTSFSCVLYVHRCHLLFARRIVV